MASEYLWIASILYRLINQELEKYQSTNQALMSPSTFTKGCHRRVLTPAKVTWFSGAGHVSRISKDCSSPWKTEAVGRHKMSPRASGSTEEHGELPPTLDCSLCSSCMCVQLSWPWWGSALTSHLSVKGESSPLEAGSFLVLVAQVCGMRENYQYRIIEYTVWRDSSELSNPNPGPV